MTPSSKTNFLLFLVALLFISTLYLLYLNFFPKPKVSTLPTVISPTSTQVSTVTWKTYTNKNGAVISYPPSWTVVNANQGFSLTQGNYQISMDFPANFGPGTCIFSDDPNFNNPFTDNEMLAGSKCPGMFTEIKAGQLIFRRINSPDANQVDTSHNQWTVYTKKNDGFFVTNPLITFKAPLDFNTKTLLEMDQILSTFKFISNIIPSPTVTKSTAKVIKYNLPVGWFSARDNSQLFEIGYNPVTQDVSMNQNSIGIVNKNLNNNPYYSPYSSTLLFRVLPYDNGSRHTFIEKQIGEAINGGNKTPDYFETEIIIGGKSCLILNGISISQFYTIWGMCAINTKQALLFSTFSYTDLLKNLSSLKFNL